MNTILIKNAILITFDPENPVLKNKKVIIKNDQIDNIVDQAPKNLKFNEVLDGRGKVLLPAFINVHTHLYSTFARGLTNIKASKNFKQVLENLWWRLDKNLTYGDIFYSALVVLINAIKFGTTTIFDHHASPYAIKNSLFIIKDAIEHLGLRGCLCYETSDRDGRAIAQSGIEENLDFIRYCNENPSSKIKSLFGLHAAFTLSDNTLKKIQKLTNEINTGFHIHVAEDKIDQKISLSKYKKSVIQRLNDFSILNNKTILAHCVHISENEMDIIREKDSNVAYNPQSNLNNAVGIADVLKMRNKNINVGLGTDGMTMNMLSELRTGIWIQHLKNNNPSACFNEICDFLFINNPRITEKIFDIKVGKIKKGYKADLVLVDYYPPTELNEKNYYSHLVFGISQEMIDTTICDGKILMHDKILSNIDEERINYKAQKIAKKLWNRI